MSWRRYFAKLENVDELCVTGVDTGGVNEDITMIFCLSCEPDKKVVAELSEAINEINCALPMYKKLNKVLISKKPLPTANGIKVQRQKLKKLIEENKWEANVLDVARQTIIEGGCLVKRDRKRY